MCLSNALTPPTSIILLKSPTLGAPFICLECSIFSRFRVSDRIMDDEYDINKFFWHFKKEFIPKCQFQNPKIVKFAGWSHIWDHPNRTFVRQSPEKSWKSDFFLIVTTKKFLNFFYQNVLQNVFNKLCRTTNTRTRRKVVQTRI